MAISWQEAIGAAQRKINALAAEQGCGSPLTGHDMAVLAAYGAGEATYNATLAKHGDNPAFDEQAVGYAAKLIAQALLV
jgi:hypothetical protein